MCYRSKEKCIESNGNDGGRGFQEEVALALELKQKF